MNELVLGVAMVSAKVFGVLLLADFVSGVVHWMQDAYGKESWPLVGKYIFSPNVEHHFHPRRFTKSSFLKRNRIVGIIVICIALVVMVSGGLNWMWLEFLVVSFLANEIHCWTHRSKRENGPVITWLQRYRIIQTPKMHAIHHTDPKNCSYCAITNFVNPVLDRMRFFERVEQVILALTGIKRNVDPSVKV